MKIIASVLLFLSFATVSLGHVTTDTISKVCSYKELMDTIQVFNSEGTKKLVIRDSKIQFKTEREPGFRFSATNVQEHSVNMELVFLNCHFEEATFHNVKFLMGLTIKNSVLETLLFHDCTFKRKVGISDNQSVQSVLFKRCNFFDRVQIRQNHISDALQFIDNTFSIENYEVGVYQVQREDTIRWHRLLVIQSNHGSEQCRLELIGNDFLKEDQLDKINPAKVIVEVAGNTFAFLELKDNHVNAHASFYNTHITGYLMGQDNDFKHAVDLTHFSFPSTFSWFPWSQLKNKVVVKTDSRTLTPFYYRFTHPKSASGAEVLSRFMSVYTGFYNMYQNNRDIESSKECTLDFRDFQSRNADFLLSTALCIFKLTSCHGYSLRRILLSIIVSVLSFTAVNFCLLGGVRYKPTWELTLKKHPRKLLKTSLLNAIQGFTTFQITNHRKQKGCWFTFFGFLQ